MLGVEALSPLPSPAICTLLRGHSEACVLFPCKWKCALNLSASLGSSWPSVSAPNGVFKTTRHRRQRWAFRSWIGWIFSDKSGTSCGPAVGPGRNCQDSLADAAVPQGLPLFARAPCTQVSRRVARMGGSASAALGCLAFHL